MQHKCACVSYMILQTLRTERSKKMCRPLRFFPRTDHQLAHCCCNVLLGPGLKPIFFLAESIPPWSALGSKATKLRWERKPGRAGLKQGGDIVAIGAQLSIPRVWQCIESREEPFKSRLKKTRLDKAKGRRKNQDYIYVCVMESMSVCVSV